MYLLFQLGVQDADGFQLKSGLKNSSAVSAQKSTSNESGPSSLNLITVVEKHPTKSGDDLRTRTESFEVFTCLPNRFSVPFSERRRRSVLFVQRRRS